MSDSAPNPIPPPSPSAPPLAALTLAEAANDDALLSRFLDAMAAKGLELYAEQEEAVLELLAGRNVILNTPTGSGKSRTGS